MADGSYVYLSAVIHPGETFALSDVSEREKEFLVDGQHYTSRFVEADKANVRYAFEQAELQRFQSGEGEIGLNPGVYR
jgi:hypothetical protein